MFPQCHLECLPIDQLNKLAVLGRQQPGPWPTKLPIRMVTDYLSPGLQEDTVICLGGGGRYSEALDIARLAPRRTKIIVVDQDLTSLAETQNLVKRNQSKRVTFQNFDARSPDFVASVGSGKAKVVTMKGLITNLLLEHDVHQVVNVARETLANGGQLIISDCIFGPDEEKMQSFVQQGYWPFTEGRSKPSEPEYWLVRYAKTFHALQYLVTEAQTENLYGIVTLRPRFLSTLEVNSLTVQDLIDAIQTHQFAGFTRHWSGQKLQQTVAQAGFEIETAKTSHLMLDGNNPQSTGIFNLLLEAKKR